MLGMTTDQIAQMSWLIWVFVLRTYQRVCFLMLCRICFHWKSNEMMRNVPKGPLCKLRTTQALISLRIRAGWSWPSLSAYRISGYCSICGDKTARMRTLIWTLAVRKRHKRSSPTLRVVWSRNSSYSRPFHIVVMLQVIQKWKVAFGNKEYITDRKWESRFYCDSS